MTNPAPAPAASDGALDLLIDMDQLKQDIAIGSDIDDVSAKHSGLYLHYAAIAVRARRQHERWKTTLEVLESSLNASYRNTLMEEYEALVAADPKAKVKPPTEAQVRAAVVSDQKWKAASARVIDAQQVFKLAEAAERAFEHRKDMIGHLSRNAQRETGGGNFRAELNRSTVASRESIMQSMRANASKGEPETT
jgi:hypothetical protein